MISGRPKHAPPGISPGGAFPYPGDIHMPTPNDMPPRSVPLRVRVARTLSAVLDRIDTDGPMPGDKPHALLRYVAELAAAEAALQACALEHRKANP